jgi:DNA-binding CsgD family transcriptional regulator
VVSREYLCREPVHHILGSLRSSSLIGTLVTSRGCGDVTTDDRIEHLSDRDASAPVLGLIGRERELAELRRLIRSGRAAGSALVVRGDAGAGTSELLVAAGDCASAEGIRVLNVSGVKAEARLPYAGLYSMLRPILPNLDQLASPQRAAISAAFGMRHDAEAAPFMIGLATLGLLSLVARRDPLLLLVDDAQWLDRPTWETLTFVARRLGPERIVLLVGVSDGDATGLDLADLPQLRLRGLDGAAAAKVVDGCAPELAANLRAVVIEQAAGNPLALRELSRSLVEQRRGDRLPATALELPLGDRLTRMFSSRLAGLSPATLAVLLLASCDDRVLVAEVLEAARSLGAPARGAVDAIAPAVDAGVVVVEGPRLRFAHPLIRSAIYQGTGLAERRQAHAAMSGAVRGDPFRHVWHRALSIIGPDTGIAADLHRAAQVERASGRMANAFTAFAQAARLGDDPAACARSLLAAAATAFELGRTDIERRLVLKASALDLESPEKGLVACALVLLEDGQAAARSDKLMQYARTTTDRFEARREVFRAAVNSLWIGPDAQGGRMILGAHASLGLAGDDPWGLAISSLVGSPEEREHACIALARIPVDAAQSADGAFALGLATTALAQPEAAAGFLSHAVEGFRVHHRALGLAQALTLRSWTRIATSRLDEAASDAEEGVHFASIADQPLWKARALAASAMLAAMRGDEDAVERFADEADRIAIPRRGVAAIADVLIARGHGSLAAGRYADCARALAPLYDDRDHGATSFQRVSAIGDFVEASARTGDLTAARAALADLLNVLPRSVVERRSELAYAQALLADDSEAEGRFRAASERARDTPPFARARIRFAYGTWLRRERRVVDSREPLERAAIGFEALGATPWANRARHELRATGVHLRRASSSPLELTPQEILVAQMAASGMSNRQIGQRLLLSPRTVGAHLYRVFPKLGVASRGELHHALARENMPVPARA